jgi:GTP cyclohydrolase II
MLRKLGVRSVALMTNNPEKVSDMQRYGIVVSRRVAHEVPVHEHDRKYLETKKDRFGHLLNLSHARAAD